MTGAAAVVFTLLSGVTLVISACHLTKACPEETREFNRGLGLSYLSIGVACAGIAFLGATGVI